MKHTKPNPNNVPGFWDIKIDSNNLNLDGNPKLFYENENKSIQIFDNVLNDDSVEFLKSLFLNCNIEAPVSIHGLKDEMSGIGSMRATGWSEEIAAQLTELILPNLSVLFANEFTATDWFQDGKHEIWSPVEVSPMLRFMKYQKNSEHYAHYDAGYFYDDGIHRTLKSLVLYLTTNDTCATRFINDDQEKIPVWDRNFNDWNHRVNDEQVYLNSKSVKGRALIFDHRLCHDVELYDGVEGNRIIIRGDIIFKKI